MRKAIALIATLAILVVVNLSIYQKEQHLAQGEVLLLELAPVDPRSLMQGDYMALRFEVGEEIRAALSVGADEQASEGYAVVTIDDQGIARFNRLASQEDVLADGERKLFFRQRNDRILFATNAYFFKEGEAERYEAARYGRFRVNEKGEPLLVGLHDEGLGRLDPADG